MSIASEIQRIRSNVASAYAALAARGAAMPASMDTDHLAATVAAQPVPVEYLEAADGCGWIDTGRAVTTTTRVEARFVPMSTAVQQRLFGVNDGSGKAFAIYVNNNVQWAVNTGTSSGGAVALVRTGVVIDCSIDLGTGDCNVGGATRSNGGTPFASTNTIPLFARRNTGTAIYADYPSAMRLVFFRIYEAGALKLDLVPVRVGAECLLRDTLTGSLHGNEAPSSGSFVPGPDLL